ncbi:nitrate/nitrite transporter [Sutcliffiella cohnii]|uniref:Nitrate/nitrite transporter n=1 Tax=Sutcliffiella cohnii TaxID=33932 RepID=A0A223KU75_9BACI|nr:MFS transporter [Sutcliffiella cohnii]AST93051.1 nitrate/nitrite transporter [Sutcliffiella cohnii]
MRLTEWNPSDPIFWERIGKKIAYRNLIISTLALHLAFCIWQMWSVMTINLASVGFTYTTDQMFTLTAIPALVGAVLRLFYSIAITYLGGRNWTVISTIVLIIPAIGIGLAIQNPNTPFFTMAILSALCGVGGANFASSMANIGPFFPKDKQGTALGINGGIGNLGVSVVQFVAPAVVGIPLFGMLLGGPQKMMSENGTESIWLQNGAFIWVIPLVVISIFAFFGMNNLPAPKVSLLEQAQVFKGKHMYLITILYIMSFGSFIGYSAAFPLLITKQFPEVNALQFAFLGPLLGASFRTVGGYFADKFGGAIVTFIAVIIMVFGTGGVVYFVGENTSSFLGFYLMFMILFLAGGIANGSIFRMIPIIFGPKETPAAIGFSAAIGAFGGFFIPKLFGWSFEWFGGSQFALYVFISYYLLCAIILWIYYARPGAELKC